MSESQALIQRLLSAQNADGGWSYRRGASWAEPTAFAVLALEPGVGAGPRPESGVAHAFKRGIEWLLLQQKISGGWAPTPVVNECTAVTSIVTLALLPFAPETLDKALNWTAGQVYRNHLSLSLLLTRTLNLPPTHAPGSVPWYPGTAGWVTPTALTALTLMRASVERNRPELRDIALECCAHLLSRRCVDSGWNHGGAKTRSEDATSYPETTGVALLALRAAAINQPQDAVDLGKRFGAAPQSMEGLCWIQLALHSIKQPIPDPATPPVPRTTRDVALRLITISARNGHNPFLSA